MDAILVRSKNNIIGYNGKLPWKIPEEMQHFKNITKQYDYVIMGRKTAESLPKNFFIKEDMQYIIITSTSMPYIWIRNIQNCRYMHTTGELLTFIKDKKSIVIGGSKLIQSVLKYIKIFHLTSIDLEFTGDVYFNDKLVDFTCDKNSDKYDICENVTYTKLQSNLEV